MRNFSTVGYDVIHTGRGFAAPYQCFDKAITDLAIALDLDRSRVHQAFVELIALSNPDILSKDALLTRAWDGDQRNWKGTLYSFAPSDLGVMASFICFYLSVKEGSYALVGGTVFSYCNLNTGRSFFWFHHDE